VVYTSEYPIFSVTVDVVLLTVCDDQLCVMVVERGEEPFARRWALPGGFVHPDEDLPEAAKRELVEETGLSADPRHFEQLASFGKPGRDPRGNVVSVAWLAVVPHAPEPAAGSDAANAVWQPADPLLLQGRLAFDHHDILEEGVRRARSKFEYTGIATAFVEEEFTIAELRGVYEVMWGRELDPGNFHRKVTRTEDFVVPTGRVVQRGPGRPAALYRRGKAQLLLPPLLRRDV
jgi:8-oxo-dGTP diphosphatase